MAFFGTKNLTQLLEKFDIINPFDSKRIENGAYELTLGDQVFQTGAKPKKVKSLKKNEKIYIEPGQFALLLTEEYIKIPKTKIAFISIKAGVKFKGLVNVSGFHVDPGFEGKLLFSVYNAGPKTIVLSRGSAYFPMWFAELNESQDYTGKHDKQINIPNDPVEALSQGEIASPNVLSKRIDTVRHLKTKIEWVFLAVLTLLIALSVKLWTDYNKLKDAVDYGYKRKSEELLTDSVYNKMQSKINSLNNKVDSLTKIVNGPKGLSSKSSQKR
jgi:dCTP deaminase